MDFAYSSENVTELSKALIEVQKVLAPAPKDAENRFVKAKYATLNSVMSTCKPALLANGILLTQYPIPVEGENLGLVTKLVHAESGQFLASLAVIPLSKHDPQAMGSAITYGRRYSLSAMLGIVTEEDDDGNMATYTTQPANYRQRNSQANPVRQESAPPKKQTIPVWNNLITCMDELGLKDLIPYYKKYINGVYKHSIEKLTSEQYHEQNLAMEQCRTDPLAMRNFMRLLHSYM